MQNAFIESINGRLRDELLNETLPSSLAQARVALGCWRADYNGSRPHSQLDWKTPSEFAFTFHPRRDLAPPTAPRQLPSLPPPNRANPTAGANSGLDKGGKVRIIEIAAPRYRQPNGSLRANTYDRGGSDVIHWRALPSYHALKIAILRANC